MRVALTTLSLVVALTLAACGGDGKQGATTTAVGEACDEAAVPEPKQVDIEPPPRRPSANDLIAVVETSCGSFEIALATRGNPKTTASFEHLAEVGAYDNTLWNRIVPGFVIQGGDPTGTGNGGPGYSVDEPPPADTEYTKGVVAMTKTEAEPPGRSGSQFFVVSGVDAGLPAQYAIVGEVTTGFDVVQTIDGFGDPQAGDAGTPLEPVLIDSVTIEER